MVVELQPLEAIMEVEVVVEQPHLHPQLIEVLKTKVVSLGRLDLNHLSLVRVS